MQTIDQALDRLKSSKFRSGFHLNEDDIRYIQMKGISLIRSHAEDFVRKKLAPAVPDNDGKQTPTHGHPVFKAMHATACCCRGCMNRWYKVPRNRELTESEQKRVVNLLMAWIEEQVSHYNIKA